IARLVGLYYLDQEPDPDVEHDYRIVGYWADATRRYTVHELSRPNTEPLGPVVLTQAESPVEVGELPGAPPVTVIDDRAAGLVWTPPDEEPDVFFGPIEEIEAVVFHAEHKPLEGSGSPPVCPVATDATGFAPLQRPGDDGETPEERPPVAVSPVEDPDTGDLSWPRYYLFDRDLDYGCHAYRVLGQDVFGRPAPPSSPRVATVHDLTPPPPPTLVKADFYQRADTSLPASVREQYLPETDDNEFALVVSWVWTDEMAARVDDVESFQVHLHHTDHDSFVATQPWRDAATWEESLGAPVPFAPALPMPVRYTSLAVPVLGSYWEVVLTDDDVSAASIGLAAGDTEPVEYAWVGVSATDHAPYNNQGAVSVPVLTLGRDLTPPDPPDPPPALAGPVGPADDSGNSALRLEWPGNPLYTYQLHRVNVLDLGPIAPVAGGQLPACLGDEQPECDPGVDGDECLEEIEEFDIRATATQNPGAFLQASPLPLEVVAGQAGHGDSVDATVSSRWLYAAKAVDAAGNVSDLSCPSHVILVEDGVPPRAPVWTEAVGGDGHVVLTWAANPESDLDEYAVYRTAFSERTASRRRMVELARIRADGTRVGPGAGAVPGGSGAYGTLTWEDVDATPGTVWRYRLDAVDLTGNRSPLSGVATARSYDATPPAAPVWAAPALTAGPGPGGAPQVTLAWVPPPDDPELAILVQRRQQGTAAWRSQGAWLDAGTVAWVDQGVEAGVTYEYRLRAMDPSGNRSVGFSVVESVVVPE
ncbi:MAG: hypothetical protein R3325_14370, partial [Thermoanaerobaculia bacterium]|nr:hypothetical protein [Thermoanaerobaculia bacterium]